MAPKYGRPDFRPSAIRPVRISRVYQSNALNLMAVPPRRQSEREPIRRSDRLLRDLVGDGIHSIVRIRRITIDLGPTALLWLQEIERQRE